MIIMQSRLHHQSSEEVHMNSYSLLQKQEDQTLPEIFSGKLWNSQYEDEVYILAHNVTRLNHAQ